MINTNISETTTNIKTSSSITGTEYTLDGFQPKMISLVDGKKTASINALECIFNLFSISIIVSVSVVD
jgi:hypothetical protein